MKKGLLSKSEILEAAPVLTEEQYQLLLSGGETAEQRREAVMLVRTRKQAIRDARDKKVDEAVCNERRPTDWVPDPNVAKCRVRVPYRVTWADEEQMQLQGD